MSYSTPALSALIVLAGGYSAPALSAPIVTCVSGTYQDVTLATTFDLDDLPLSFAGSVQVSRYGHYSPPSLAVPLGIVCGGVGYDPPPISYPVVACAPVVACTPVVELAAFAEFSSDVVELTFSAHAAMVVGMALGGVFADTGDDEGAFSGVVEQVITAGLLAECVGDTDGVLSCAASADQLLDLIDADGASTSRALGAGEGVKTASALSVCHADAVSTRSRLWENWTSAYPIRTLAWVWHAEASRSRSLVAFTHAEAIPVGAGESDGHAEAVRIRSRLVLREQQAEQVSALVMAQHAEQIRTRLGLWAPHRSAHPACKGLLAPWAECLRVGVPLDVRHQQGLPPKPGRWWRWYDAPVFVVVLPCAGGYTPRPLVCRVVLDITAVSQPYCYGWPPEDGIIKIPIRRLYMVRNSFSLMRVEDNAEVYASGFSASISAGDFCWTWSADLPGRQLAKVLSSDPSDPVEIVATINGFALRLIAETPSTAREAGKYSVKVSGRGRSAWLASPYAPVLSWTNTEAMTAAQCAALGLTENGTGIGWDVDWRLEDWLVAAGAFVVSGAHIDAVARVAASGGGYVMPHPTDQVLSVLPYYKVKPWLWESASVDIELPEDVVVVEDVARTVKPLYNAVHVVGGANGGRGDVIKRAGTAGGNPAPTVVDSLATSPIMTRQRGVRVLGETGRIAMISLKLPILSQTGVILPGTMIRYYAEGVPAIGVSRSVSLAADFYQTIVVETREAA